MIDESTSWRWEARSPLTTGREGVDLQRVPKWIEEIWRLRGLVLFDNGRRLQFRQADGKLADRDPLDLLAYHILGWYSDTLVGCIRFVPVAAPLPCLTERILGAARFEEVLMSLGTSRRAVVDVGRWIVHPDHRGFRVALSLVGACWSYVQCLGYEVALATVGTRAGQATILQRTGLVPIPGLAAHACDAFDDELRTMYAVVSEPAPNFRGMVQQMEKRIFAQHPETEALRYSESA